MLYLLTSTSLFSTAPATADIYPLSLHDALPIYRDPVADEADLAVEHDGVVRRRLGPALARGRVRDARHVLDRKSTRLNSSHSQISYAVFCLKKKNTNR